MKSCGVQWACCAIAVAVLVGCASTSGGQSGARPGEIALFNGKDLTGWKGNPEVFRVEDGVIVAGRLGHEVAENQYLCTTATFGDFELRAQVKVSSDHHANSGIQFWTSYQDHYEVRGFQADTGFHMGEIIWGGLWDNGRRNDDLAVGVAEELKEVYRSGDWNDLRVRAQGDHIQIWFNGLQTVDYTEQEADIERTGMFGFQMHVGPPSETRYRNLYVKKL
jgi:hypothetical protein